MQNLAKMKDILFILLVTGVFTLISNLAGGHIKTIGEPSIGVLILVAISALGALLSMLPGFKKLPMVFWVSLIAVVVSLPQFPGSDVLLSYTKQVNFLAITTPARTSKPSASSRGASSRWPSPSRLGASSAPPSSRKSCCTSKEFSDFVHLTH